MKTFCKASFAAIILLLAVGCGDQVPTAGPSTTSATSSDQSFVNDVAIGGLTEVKLGELATKNGSSKAVKDFGAKMVTDHGKANTELAELAAKKNWKIPVAVDSKHQKDIDKFSALNGDAFDKDYVKDMVEDHEKDVKDVKDAIPKINDPDLKKWAQSALDTMEEHLKIIKSIKG